MDQYQEILDQSHLLDQEKFVNFFDNFLKKTQITKTSFIEPRDGDLKNSPINNYLSRMGKGQASDGNCNTVLEFFLNRCNFFIFLFFRNVCILSNTFWNRRRLYSYWKFSTRK